VIIDTLMKRGYASGTASIEVSDFGLKVCEVLQKYAPEILDENLTRKLEDEMEGIQDGKTDKDAVIAEGKEILIGILGKWKANEAKIGADLAEALKATLEQENMVGVCDKCGKNLRIIRLGAGRQFIGCTGYPACRNAYPLPGGAFVKVTGKPCPSCGKPTVFVKRSGGRPFTMCIDPKCPSKAGWGKKKEAVAAPAAGAGPAAAEAKPAVAAEAAPAKKKRKPAKKAAKAAAPAAPEGQE
jgi:DNA topoisomerase I